MANEQNLRPVKTHEEAVQRGRKGGLSKSPLQRWARIKTCNNKCPFYESCPAISTSQALPDKNCFIKSNPKEIQNYFIQLYCCGEAGLIKVMMDIHFKLMLKTHKRDVSAKELRDALLVSIDLKKGIFGDKQKIEHSGSIVQIVDNIPKPEKKDDQTP